MKLFKSATERILRALYINSLLKEMGKPELELDTFTVKMSADDFEEAYEELKSTYKENVLMENSGILKETRKDIDSFLSLEGAIIGIGGINYIENRYKIDNISTLEEKMQFILKLDNPLELLKYE